VARKRSLRLRQPNESGPLSKRIQLARVPKAVFVSQPATPDEVFIGRHRFALTMLLH
jgi:hypothetical protein